MKSAQSKSPRYVQGSGTQSRQQYQTLETPQQTYVVASRARSISQKIDHQQLSNKKPTNEIIQSEFKPQQSKANLTKPKLSEHNNRQYQVNQDYVMLENQKLREEILMLKNIIKDVAPVITQYSHDFKALDKVSLETIQQFGEQTLIPSQETIHLRQVITTPRKSLFDYQTIQQAQQIQQPTIIPSSSAYKIGLNGHMRKGSVTNSCEVSDVYEVQAKEVYDSKHLKQINELNQFCQQLRKPKNQVNEYKRNQKVVNQFEPKKGFASNHHQQNYGSPIQILNPEQTYFQYQDQQYVVVPSRNGVVSQCGSGNFSSTMSDDEGSIPINTMKKQNLQDAPKFSNLHEIKSASETFEEKYSSNSERREYHDKPEMIHPEPQFYNEESNLLMESYSSVQSNTSRGTDRLKQEVFGQTKRCTEHLAQALYMSRDRTRMDEDYFNNLMEQLHQCSESNLFQHLREGSFDTQKFLEGQLTDDHHMEAFQSRDLLKNDTLFQSKRTSEDPMLQMLFKNESPLRYNMQSNLASKRQSEMIMTQYNQFRTPKQQSLTNTQKSSPKQFLIKENQFDSESETIQNFLLENTTKNLKSNVLDDSEPHQHQLLIQQCEQPHLSFTKNIPTDQTHEYQQSLEKQHSLQQTLTGPAQLVQQAVILSPQKIGSKQKQAKKQGSLQKTASRQANSKPKLKDYIQANQQKIQQERQKYFKSPTKSQSVEKVTQETKEVVSLNEKITVEDVEQVSLKMITPIKQGINDNLNNTERGQPISITQSPNIQSPSICQAGRFQKLAQNVKKLRMILEDSFSDQKSKPQESDISTSPLSHHFTNFNRPSPIKSYQLTVLDIHSQEQPPSDHESSQASRLQTIEEEPQLTNAIMSQESLCEEVCTFDKDPTIGQFEKVMKEYLRDSQRNAPVSKTPSFQENLGSCEVRSTTQTPEIRACGFEVTPKGSHEQQQFTTMITVLQKQESFNQCEQTFSLESKTKQATQEHSRTEIKTFAQQMQDQYLEAYFTNSQKGIVQHLNDQTANTVYPVYSDSQHSSKISLTNVDMQDAQIFSLSPDEEPYKTSKLKKPTSVQRFKTPVKTQEQQVQSLTPRMSANHSHLLEQQPVRSTNTTQNVISPENSRKMYYRVASPIRVEREYVQRTHREVPENKEKAMLAKLEELQKKLDIKQSKRTHLNEVLQSNYQSTTLESNMDSKSQQNIPLSQRSKILSQGNEVRVMQREPSNQALKSQQMNHHRQITLLEKMKSKEERINALQIKKREFEEHKIMKRQYDQKLQAQKSASKLPQTTDYNYHSAQHSNQKSSQLPMSLLSPQPQLRQDLTARCSAANNQNFSVRQLQQEQFGNSKQAIQHFKITLRNMMQEESSRSVRALAEDNEVMSLRHKGLSKGRKQ